MDLLSIPYEPGADKADSPHQRCPKCDGDRVRAASLAGAFVYLRCAACGEVWAIAERRAMKPRSTDTQERMSETGPPERVPDFAARPDVGPRA